MSDARAEVDRALAMAAGTEDELYGPEIGTMAIRCLADEADDAQAHGRAVDLDKLQLLALGFVQEVERLVAGPLHRGGTNTPRARAFAAMSRAEASRLDDSDPDLWAAAARAWEEAGEPYPAATCHWPEPTLVAGRKFIGGLPMKLPTNRAAGLR